MTKINPMSHESHPAAAPSKQLLSQCEVTRLRRSGPGGQHRNKVETAVVIEHRPTGIRGEASERRSQAENWRTALFRLRVNLALEIRRQKSAGDAADALWKSRVQNGRIDVNPTHDDFPALLAEALDGISLRSFDLKLAADDLDCTVSQLTKFLKIQPRALEQVNARRRELGLRAMR